MIFIATIAATALQIGAAAQLAQTAPAPTARSAQPLSFDGAALGMSVAAWKALPPPPGMATTAAADCGQGIAAALRQARIAAATPAPGHATCAYDERFGADVLLDSARLDGRYRIRDLRYRFAGDRLAEIDYTASIDAYDDIVARLSGKYGSPATTVRDVMRTPAGRFPRVRQTWRTGSGVVSLDDPTDNPLRLGVRMASASGGG